MKVIQVHNFYQIAGGEDTVVQAEKEMLEEAGHEVIQYLKHNKEIDSYSARKKMSLIKKTSWSEASKNEFLDFLELHKPDVCHVHNFFPLISPAVFEACNEKKVPVVMTLHNYRLICSNGLFFREGSVCEKCLTKSAYGAVIKKCYRNSMVQTYAVARMIEKNKSRGTWQNKVDAFICLTDFAKSKFEKHGLPAEKLKVKSNFLSLETLSEEKSEQPYFIFVGRLTDAKGVRLLMKAAKKSKLPIRIIGEGELSPELKGIKNIDYLGRLSQNVTLRQIKNAEALILPSLWYEGMPMTILEAFSQKTTVIASDLGGMKSMIDDGVNGFLIEPNSEKQLIEKLNFILEEPGENKLVGEKGHEKYVKEYSKESNYDHLISIYNSLIS